MPPNRPNPRPPAPIRSMSRRETPQSDNRVLLIMVFAPPMFLLENRLGSAPGDSDGPASSRSGVAGRPRIAPFDIVRHGGGWDARAEDRLRSGPSPVRRDNNG